MRSLADCVIRLLSHCCDCAGLREAYSTFGAGGARLISSDVFDAAAAHYVEFRLVASTQTVEQQQRLQRRRDNIARLLPPLMVHTGAGSLAVALVRALNSSTSAAVAGEPSDMLQPSPQSAPPLPSVVLHPERLGAGSLDRIPLSPVSLPSAVLAPEHLHPPPLDRLSDEVHGPPVMPHAVMQRFLARSARSGVTVSTTSATPAIPAGTLTPMVAATVAGPSVRERAQAMQAAAAAQATLHICNTQTQLGPRAAEAVSFESIANTLYPSLMRSVPDTFSTLERLSEGHILDAERRRSPQLLSITLQEWELERARQQGRDQQIQQVYM